MHILIKDTGNGFHFCRVSSPIVDKFPMGHHNPLIITF